MSEPSSYQVGAIRLKSAIKLADKDLELLGQAMNSTQTQVGTSLEGRGNVVRLTLSNSTDVVVKRYSRGGLLRLLLGTHFLKLGAIRSKQEYDFLLRARLGGINAPEPLAYAWRGEYWYEAWLITKEVPDAQSLAELSRQSGEIALAVKAAAEQVLKLIEARYFHIDLHPGNILIDRAGCAFVLDFDKAKIFHGKKTRLRDIYLSRWRRAAIKHALPDPVVELMSLELRRRVG